MAKHRKEDKRKSEPCTGGVDCKAKRGDHTGHCLSLEVQPH
jgi:hypothetical protein